MEIRNDSMSRIAIGEDGDGVQMLWVPNVEKPAHQHIHFTLEEARRLYEFLHEFLAENLR